MGRSFSEVCVGDLALRSDLAGEGQSALGVSQNGAPVLLVARIHPAAQNTLVDLGEQIKRIFPPVHPIQSSVGSLDEAVNRHEQSSDDLSHVRSPFNCV